MPSSPSIAAPFSANCADLLGDVDADRTPGDAASAADTAGGAELIDPVGQLVRHPLSVARLGRAAHRSAMDVGKIHGEAGVPSPLALGCAGQRILILDGSTET